MRVGLWHYVILQIVYSRVWRQRVPTGWYQEAGKCTVIPLPS